MILRRYGQIVYQVAKKSAFLHVMLVENRRASEASSICVMKILFEMWFEWGVYCHAHNKANKRRTITYALCHVISLAVTISHHFFSVKFFYRFDWKRKWKEKNAKSKKFSLNALSKLPSSRTHKHIPTHTHIQFIQHTSRTLCAYIERQRRASMHAAW